MSQDKEPSGKLHWTIRGAELQEVKWLAHRHAPDFAGDFVWHLRVGAMTLSISPF
jgi:hypothetical protein